ncbi:DUF1553 domain-containing protein [Tamlana fucoidanivorans]|uniref:DUF1553 domain-containing protein n=1 Tax=Allotamlana fucoidanivorans TaxID=2583814 RepID=A0A5C4SHJ5_9FLAO|nr:DUF1553 domain-containing protein [Tamlana fucoidanivorans]TNJ43139.1 DUF1553 domain-containing protein [Tamlana fucoidanivorans]
MRLSFLVLVTLVCCACNNVDIPDSVYVEYQKLPKKVDFNQHVKPILSDKCFLCHGPDKDNIKGGLQLHTAELAYAELSESPGIYPIKPKNLNKSEVFHRILSEDPELVMPVPSSHLTLDDYEKAVLIKWIEDGAEYKDHWAFIKPVKHEIPDVKHKNQVANGIDNFVLEELELVGLKLSEKADKELLLRRASLDLTGLQPTIEELDVFLKDESPEAYEKQIDRLLASLQYGEQRTLDWMDVARYADTHGYSVDWYRDVSPWRDWVIKAFNENMPYDEFILWQLAGDMLPNATREQRLATTFNRLHPQNLEGGIIDEEFRSEYVSDRTATVGQAFLGLTVACAKCHDHKYDPISQKDHFELYSFFNNVNETGLIPWDLATPVPTMLLPTNEQEELMLYLESLVDEKEKMVSEVIKNESDKANNWIINESYKTINTKQKPLGLIAHLDFNQQNFKNNVAQKEKQNIRMRQHFADNQKAVFKAGISGYGLAMDGDTWLDLDKIGIFKRDQAFSIGIQVFVPKDLKNGVIFHKMQGPELHSYRGYHLNIKDNKIEALLAHVWPDNAIVKQSLIDVPKEKWIQLTITYDGSSKASGVNIYLDGEKLETEIMVDNLYKDIIFKNQSIGIYKGKTEPGLRIGAIWRGKGLRNGMVDDILVFNRELTGLEVMQFANSTRLNQLLSKSEKELNASEKQLLKAYFVTTKSNAYKASLKELMNARSQYVDSIEPIKEIMVMKEMEKPRQAYVLDRGQYDSPTDSVFPDVPERIFAFPDDLERNRIGLSKWLTHEDNPLTARVTVNRYWQNIFGRGLVKTSEDFGNQGELPSHPKLLDWLAIKFIESGWDVKALHKLIVMSSTYQQTSIASKELMAIDKENKLLARGPSKRLSGEMLRDNALYASGLLNQKIGGESVYPYQPPGLWRVSGGTYEEGTGEALYRRSMYTIWKRTVPNPTIATFDAPTRDLCTTRRQETNTPLQALVLLNDPTFIEAARVMGKKIAGYNDLKEGVATIFRKLTGREIKSTELDVLLDLQQSELEKFKNNEAKANGWISLGEYKIEPTDDKALIAANAVVASTIINSDAFITKR